MSNHFSDCKRWASQKSKAEVIPALSEYVADEHPMDKAEDLKNWMDKMAGKQENYRSAFGPTPLEAERHNPLREAALKKLRDDSLALGDLHLKDAHAAHLSRRFAIDPKIRPNKPSKKDLPLNGFGVLGIGLALMILIIGIKLCIESQNKYFSSV